MDPLIKKLIELGVLRSKRIIEAFRAVDRKDFVRPEYVQRAYADEPLPIGHGQTISQPYTVAFMLELLEPHEGHKILDVGTGSGWTTALLAKITGERGRVYGVELIPELVVFGKSNISKYKFTRASIEQTRYTFGLPEQTPYDRILVSAASPSIPQELVDQLRVGGIMVIPVGESIVKIKKVSEKEISQETHHGFIFVPLVKKI